MFQQEIDTTTAPEMHPNERIEKTALHEGRNFTTRLIRIWDEVQRFKKVGFIKTDDDLYFIAYRTAENELREVCEEMEALKKRLKD
ncbi:hypothetical protein GXP67_30910 [Rhodocytophaga rosea]|uniref:Four helix bundle protein n=1 Tax=Rhodocytophaga rosea TaxID=2704465 RepID=A0A6C0GRQ3_9BACT|nr:hypothetical protein [Rhodocytophaga rosea]QHT70746.1 hypothetical protein GXP67_30910 [Rhodocytophaga rosea]